MTNSLESMTLRDSVSVLSGYPFPSAQFTDGIGKPLIRIRDLLGRTTETNFAGDFDPNYIVRPDDVLIGMDGDFNVVRWKGPEALLNQRVCKVTCTGEDLDGRFLYWWLKPNIESIHHRTPQTTVRHLSVGDIYRIPKPQLTARSQAFAAEVLDTLEDAIAQTEAVIAKLRQVRAGLLHDLLTRGLDHNGQLRDPVAHPEEFKDTPIGRIPKEWTVESVEQLLAPVPHAMRSGPFGSSLLKQELKPSGIPLLGIDNVHVERFEATYTRFVGEEKFQELKQYSVRPLDIMITIMGTVGRCCVVPVGIGTALSSKHVWTITLNQPRYSPHLACWQLNHAEWALRQLRVDEQGGVMTAIRSETLRRLRLPVPTGTEMKAIERILFAYTEGIEAEEKELAKLRQLKFGLWTDLLTGHVRVPKDFQHQKVKK